jgi:hypothetical protein
METTGGCVRPWFWPKNSKGGGAAAALELKAAIYRQNIFSGFKIGPSSFVFGP